MGNKNSGRRPTLGPGQTTAWRKPGGQLPPADQEPKLADDLDREIYEEIRVGLLALPFGGRHDRHLVLSMVGAERWRRRCEARLRSMGDDEFYVVQGGQLKSHPIVKDFNMATLQCADLLHRLMLSPKSRAAMKVNLSTQMDGSLGEENSPGAPNRGALLRLMPKVGG